MKFSHNILLTYSIILSIMKRNGKIRRFWVVDPFKFTSYNEIYCGENIFLSLQ